MTYQDYKIYFTKEISESYTDSESSMLYDIFVHHLTTWNLVEFRKAMNQEIEQQHSLELQNIILQLKTGKPYQQILCETEFYGLKFFVDEHVLIPRPETEELLELAIAKIKDSGLAKKNLNILDIGTGSGIIPIVLKKRFPEAKISAIDFSENALKTAKRNADFHQVGINFIHQDYLKSDLTDVYDVIISNPPYIGMEEEDEIADSVKQF